MNRIIKLWCVIALIFANGILSGQERRNITAKDLLNPFYKDLKTKLQGNLQDTTKLKKYQTKLEDRNLIEKPIDPQTYIVGPGDVLDLNVFASNAMEYDITISPDGRAVIPEAGVVDLKDKTLAEAEQIIINKAKGVFRSTEIYVVLKEIRKFKVTVAGSVETPSTVVATAADRVSEAIEKAGGFAEDASLRNVILIRDGKKIDVDLMKFYLNGDLTVNPTLLGGDYVSVAPVNVNEILMLDGEVMQPGIFEYKNGDSLSTLLRFSQGVSLSAVIDSVEYVTFNHSANVFETHYLDLSGQYQKLISGEKLDKDFRLYPGDKLYFRRILDWPDDKYVVIEGEVVHPGYYPINEGVDRVSDVIARAGGLTKKGSADNTFMIRQDELSREDSEMKRLNSIPPSEMSESERRYYQARVAEIRGVMSIDFNLILEDNTCNDNILLLSKDSIIVGRQNNFVNVQGRVNNPGFVSYKEGGTYMDYINLAGGLGFRADDDEILVIKSKGQQYKAKKKNYVIEPGDYILVPPESELTFFEIFTTVLTITTQLITIFGVVYSVTR